MSRPSVAIRWFAVTTVVACVAALWAVLAPAPANAQTPVPASLTITVSEDAGDDAPRTIAIGVNPGDSDLAALGADLRYDSSQITMGACSVSEAGACNTAVTDVEVSDGTTFATVRLSVFNLTGIEANEQLLTVDFVPAEGATGTSVLVLSANTAADTTGSLITVQGAESELVVAGPDSTDTDSTDTDSTDTDSTDTDEPVAAPGSLTGDVTSVLDSSGLYGVSVCATQADDSSCTQTNGWGAWRIDVLSPGDYVVTFTDNTGFFASTETAATVKSGEITTGVDAALGIDSGDAAEPEQTEPETESAPGAQADEPESQDESETDEELKAKQQARDEADELAPKTSIYQASIAGSVRIAGTVDPLVGVQVCASQAFVLQQHCASTNVFGRYELIGLTTGNYVLTIVDPLGRYEMSNGRLVGISTDQTRREGVVLTAKLVG